MTITDLINYKVIYTDFYSGDYEAIAHFVDWIEQQEREKYDAEKRADS